ncbi:MAG: hypothetical protein Q9175_005684 [Cornicularia normoerica]
MSGKQQEEHSHIAKNDLDPCSGMQHPDQLAPMMPKRQYNHDLEHYDRLPSISLYSTDYYPQYTSSATAHPCNASPDATIDPALYLPYQSSYRQESHSEGHNYRQPVHEDPRDFGQQQFQCVDSAVIHHQHSFRPSLPALTDQSCDQQASPYYGHAHLKQPYLSSSSTADYPSKPTQYHPQLLQPTSSAAAYPLPPGQQALPIFSYSSNTPHTSPSLADLQASQSDRSEPTATYQEMLAGVSGVVIPSKRALGEDPKICFCSICGTAFTRNVHVQAHFVACVERNGNPNGVRWDDGVRTRGKGNWRRRSKRMPKDARPTLPDRQPNASASDSSQSTHNPTAKVSERVKAFNDRLDSVNGVVIPSKLVPGARPTNLRSHAKANTSLTMICPLCKGAFSRKDHVKSHFATCVHRNGNPNGLRWNDGLPPDNYHLKGERRSRGYLQGRRLDDVK